tara:strand:- start:104 stop:508 length:405 start_codon:yes stop_codon:yes gene_type:complete
METSILSEILTSTAEYWLVAKETYFQSGCQEKRGEDDIIFIAIPRNIPRGVKREDIKLSDLELLDTAPLDLNIYLNSDYPPFQYGLTMRGIYKISPVEGKFSRHEFLKRAFDLDSDDFYKYEVLLSELKQPYNV